MYFIKSIDLKVSITLLESSIQLPDMSRMFNHKYKVYTWFGYDTATNDYKVARLFSLTNQGRWFGERK